MVGGEGPQTLALSNQRGSIAHSSTLFLKTKQNKAKSTNAPQPCLDKDFQGFSLRLQLAQVLLPTQGSKGLDKDFGTEQGQGIRETHGRDSPHF